jgi:dolichyl-phosphate-mannose-protein mannosyltransferase
MTGTGSTPSSQTSPFEGGNIAPGSMFLFAVCLFSLTNCGFDSSEGQGHYKVAKHFIETGQIGYEHPVTGIFTTAPNGRTYASHEFGNVLLLIPTAAASHVLDRLLTSSGVGPEKVARAQQFVVSFQASLYSALTLLFLYLMLVEEFGLTGRQAFAGCVLLATCTFFGTYSRNLFDGVLCGLLLTAAFRYLLRFRRVGRTIDALFAFGLLGLAVDTRLSMAIPTAAGLGFVALFCTGRKLRGLTAVVALAPFAAWQLCYNRLRTGSPFVSPVMTQQYAANNALDGNLGTGLIGLLFSPGKSLFVYAPLLLLSVAMFPPFWRKFRPAAAFILVVGVAWLLLHARLRSWYGAWGWGPRHFVTVLPVLAIPALVIAPTAWCSRWGRVAIVTTAAAGFLLTWASLVGNYHYRMVLRYQAGTIGDELFVWSISRSQPIDMLIGAVNNGAFVIGAGEPASVPLASDLNNYASNRINMWWYTLPRAGVPRSAVLIATSMLLVGLVLTAIRLSRQGVAS